MRIVVISPTYNEKVNIKKLIPLLEEEIFPQIKNHAMSLLIVDDHSPDGTGNEVRSFMKQWQNIALLEGDKKGLGDAYIRGMRYAMKQMKADVVIEIDSDFQHNPSDIPRLIAVMDQGADYVIGSRYVPGGQIPHEWGLHRKFMSYFGSLFARIMLLMFSVHDVTGGYKLTKTSFLQRIDLENLYSKYYAYKIQILYEAYRLGAKIVEIPITFAERKDGSSKLERKDLFDSFWVVVRLRLRDSQRFIRFLVVGGTGFMIQLLFQEGTIFIGLTYFIAGIMSGIISLFILHTDLTSLSHAIGAAFGAEAAITSNFLINNLWTFHDRRTKKGKRKKIRQYIKFNMTSLASIFLQFTVVFLGEKFLGPVTNIDQFSMPTRVLVIVPTIILIVIPLNYIIYNKIIWKKQHAYHEIS